MKRNYTKACVYGWHFRRTDGMLGYADGRFPQVGQRLQAKTRTGRSVGRPRLCAPGFHAFPDLGSCGAFSHYGPRLSFCLVEEATGRVGGNKVSGKYRTILWEGIVPEDVNRSKRGELEAWLKKAGFRRASCRRKAAAILKKAGVK